MERRSGSGPKPQEEVACRCSPIRENAGVSTNRCECPGSVARRVFRMFRLAPEPAAWKRLDTPAGMVKKASAQTHASCLCAQMSGWSSVRLCVINSAYRSPVLHWIPPCGIYSSQTQLIIANTCSSEKEGVFVYVCEFQSLKRFWQTEMKGWRCLSPQELFFLSPSSLQPHIYSIAGDIEAITFTYFTI